MPLCHANGSILIRAFGALDAWCWAAAGKAVRFLKEKQVCETPHRPGMCLRLACAAMSHAMHLGQGHVMLRWARVPPLCPDRLLMHPPTLTSCYFSGRLLLSFRSGRGSRMIFRNSMARRTHGERNAPQEITGLSSGIARGQGTSGSLLSEGKLKSRTTTEKESGTCVGIPLLTEHRVACGPICILRAAVIFT